MWSSEILICRPEAERSRKALTFKRFPAAESIHSNAIVSQTSEHRRELTYDGLRIQVVRQGVPDGLLVRLLQILTAHAPNSFHHILTTLSRFDEDCDTGMSVKRRDQILCSQDGLSVSADTVTRSYSLLSLPRLPNSDGGNSVSMALLSGHEQWDTWTSFSQLVLLSGHLAHRIQ